MWGQWHLWKQRDLRHLWATGGPLALSESGSPSRAAPAVRWKCGTCGTCGTWGTCGTSSSSDR
eukprot:3516511-Pyramimonas_sp.AAC.1